MSNKDFKRPKILIGIGASAGGLEPLQDLLTNLSSNISDAAIIIAQHLSPNYKSMLVELLARKTKIPVVEAKSGIRIEPNHIYTIPPDNDLVIQNDFIQLKRVPNISPKPSVNILFKSIAEEYGKDSVGIILSGTGQDGAIGIEAIKQKGGVTIAQLPASAKYDGMPNAAINTGQVDHIMSPKLIGSKFSKLINKKKIKATPPPVKKVKEPVAELLGMLEERVGTDFSNYKTSTIYRRLEKRMSDKKFLNIESYLKHIEKNPDELDNLFQYMLIGVTSFFRNPEVFESLTNIIDEIIINKYKDESLRIWIPGCATGEEAYTLGILVSEALNNSRLPKINIQIFATDIDQNALTIARNGIYDSSKIEKIPKEILDSYFIRRGDKYELISRIKKMILFSRHDVLNNPPFLRVDLISCRNMLIYFDQSLQKQLLPIFHYALNNEGFLLLGKSESVGHLKNLFSSVDVKNKIFQKKPADSKMIKFPHSKPILPKRNSLVSKASKKDDLSIGDMVKETLYNSIEFPYVVIDDNMEMIEIQGDVSKFLSFRPGIVNMNILKQINSDLQIELRAVITKAINISDKAKGNIKKIKDEKDNFQYIRFVVKPLMYSKPNNPLYLIIFEEYDLDESLIHFSTNPNKDDNDPHVMQLEQELEATKEHMNTLVEELEASNEELQALNEELQSSNEELQASNEELETSNEELQATNEELETAYAEINAAAEEIEQQNKKIKESENNLKTIFNSALQAFILVDKNYNVLAYNQTAEEIYKRIYGNSIKIGYSYVDLIPNDHFKIFRDSFKKALEGKTVAYEEMMVNQKNGNRYLVYNYTPVENDDPKENKDHVCISFIDDTARISAEKELHQAHQETQKQKNLWHELSLTSPDLIAILRSEEFIYEFANPSYKKLFPGKEIIGRKIFEVMPDLKEDGFIKTLDKVRKGGKAYHKKEIASKIEGKNGEIETRYFNITYAPLKTPEKENDLIIYATDITDQVRARKDLEEAHKEIEEQKNRLEELIINAPASIAVTKGPEHIIEYINPQFQIILKDKDLINNKIQDLLSQGTSESFIGYMNDVFESGKPYIAKEVHSNIFTQDEENTNCYYTLIFQPWKNKEEQVQGLILYSYDVTEQVLARKQIENTMQHFRVLTDAMPQNVWTAGPKGNFDYLNKNFTRYLGIGNNRHNIDWMKFIHPEDLDETIEAWNKALQDNSDFQIQHRIRSKDDSYKWHLTRGISYLDQTDRKIIKWIGTTTDIDDQKSTEALKEEFLSIASHELKTPLTTLKAYFDLLYSHLMQVGDDNSKEYIEKSVVHVNKLNSLIADLLDISKIEGGKINFTLEEINFDEFAEESIKNLQHTTTSHTIKLTGKTNSVIQGDKQRLEQVFANLITNAVKYSPDSNEIFINLHRENGNIITTIKDHGIGIPTEKLNKIFDRFYRVSEENNFVSGLGIGLYITKEIVKRHKGDIWARSEEHIGSEFQFSLPVTN